MVTAVGFAIRSATLASAQDLSRPSSAAEAAFLKENDAAMTKMKNEMAVKPTGDVDHDFVAMMAPHHQGAIDMSEAELRYGHNEQLRRIAQDIVIEQLQEIGAMRAASGAKLTPTEATLAASLAGTAAGRGFCSPGPSDHETPSLKRERPSLAQNDAAMRKMMDDMTIKQTGNIDRDFVARMVPHYQGAINMARVELRYGRDAQVRRIVQEIVFDQIQQISPTRFAVGEPLPPSVSSPTDLVPQPVAGQAPFHRPDIPISSHDRIYTALTASAPKRSNAPASVSLFDQGLIQVPESAVSGLQPMQSFMTNPAGAAIVNAIGPIRQLVETDVKAQRCYLVIVPATGPTVGAPVQVQVQ